MSNTNNIPVFPLAILPIPGELVPLHIFEPRYRQLLQDAESKDIAFGIYYANNDNSNKIGSLVKLESVIKKYPGGESDIIVKCVDMFNLLHFFKQMDNKLYPGGIVEFWNVDLAIKANEILSDEFNAYMQLRKIHELQAEPDLYQVANELNLDFTEKMKFIYLNSESKQNYLINRINYLKKIIEQEHKSKDIFYLN
jgi:uncharacterized protein